MGMVFILGMHRSGTSCLAGSLQHHGLFLGKVYEENPHNRKGNRENAEVMQLNDEVLAFNGGAWTRPPGALTWTDHHRLKRDAIIAAFRYEAPGTWGMKDPRFLLTLPFWTEVVRSTHCAMAGTFRHPVAAARSLHRRDTLPMEDGLRLWEHYNAALLDLLDERIFPLLCFDASFDEISQALSRMATTLGLAAKPMVDPPFADPALRHEQESAWDGVPASARRMYERLFEIYEAQACTKVSSAKSSLSFS